MPVLRYVPCSQRKGGQSPFIGCTSTDLKALNGLTFPITKLISSTVSKPPLKGFVRPSQGPEIEHGSLPTERTEEGFDPNAYKLLAKAGYDYKDSPPLGKLSRQTTGENVHGLNRTQQKLKGKGYAVKSFKNGVGYSPPPPVRMSSRKANAQYITAQSVDEDCVPVAKTSVFDRISRPTLRVSVFKRLGTQVDTNTNGIITKSNNLRHSQRICSSKKIKGHGRMIHHYPPSPQNQNHIIPASNGHIPPSSLQLEDHMPSYKKMVLFGTSMANLSGMTNAAGANPNPNKSYELVQPPTDSVSSLCFNPKGNFLVATSWDNQVRCWEIARTGATIGSMPKASISHDQPVLCSTWKDDGTTVFSGGCDKQVKMWPLMSGGQPMTVAIHDAPIKEVAWIPEMNLLATGSWDKTLKLHPSFVSQNTSFVFGCKNAGGIPENRHLNFHEKYWDTRQPNPVHTQQLPDRCYALTVRHPLMVVGTADRNLIVFNLQNPQVLVLNYQLLNDDDKVALRY
ncbi:hypothetical protein HHK36_008032 [Tetracentron sinense]|uniref:Uncharacterized protein n=1 Tax=Tetracentron sinense TaxID=13715 RepID=A0A834ZDZ1_TETSI|nr:hypothetical protein HHK36_008032 [Tetracentron sinense]